MTALAGYIGSFYVGSDIAATATNESVGPGDGSTTVFNLANANVDRESLNLKVGGVARTLGVQYDLTPTGVITFGTAPTSDAGISATYDYYNMIEGGGFTNWSLDVTAEALDRTNFTSGQNREFIAGLRQWSGSAEGHWANDLPSDIEGTEQLLKFYMDETNSDFYYGWGIVTGINWAAAVDGLVDENLSFQGTYALHVSDA